jgi:hypothetical protein
VKRVCILTLALFVALSACDFALTYLLVEGSGGEVYEANPVAAPWLADHGWMGLAAFKLTAVLVVIGAVGLIARRKPAIGVAVACAACLATAVVNLHSHRLLAAAETSAVDTEQDERLLAADLARPAPTLARQRLPLAFEHDAAAQDRP